MKVLIKVFASIFTIGALLLVGALIFQKGDVSSMLRGEKRVYKEIIIDQEVESLFFDIESDDVEFYDSSDDKLKIEYYDTENSDYKYSYNNKDIKLEFSKKFSIFNIKKYTVKVYLPVKEYEEFNIKLTTGDFEAFNEAINCSKINISITTGDTKINKANVVDLKIVSTTGEVSLNEVKGTNMEIEATTGKLDIKDVQFTTSRLVSTTGTIKVEDLTTEDLRIASTTGRVLGENVVSTSTVIKATTGLIKFAFKDEANDYSISAKSNTGNILLTGSNLRITSSNSLSWGIGEKIIDASTTTGSITISFK